MPDLFKEIVPSILQTKNNVLVEEQDEKDYNPFIVNRAIAYHIDCILHANMMNLYHGLDKKLQYDYLLNSINGMKRKFQPWQKQLVINDLECVKEYYGFSNQKAKEALNILTKEQIASIRNDNNKGGIVK